MSLELTPGTTYNIHYMDSDSDLIRSHKIYSRQEGENYIFTEAGELPLVLETNKRKNKIEQIQSPGDWHLGVNEEYYTSGEETNTNINSRKERKSRKQRKSRKSRKQRKSRKSRK